MALLDHLDRTILTLTDDDVAQTWDGPWQRLALTVWGIRTLIVCYQDLGESDAARHALEKMIDHLAEVDFSGAASQARLAPWRKDDPPGGGLDRNAEADHGRAAEAP